MTVVLTIPSTAVPAGAGQQTSPAIPTAASVYLLTIQQVAWPHTGGLAFSLNLQISYDGAVTWTPLTSENVPDETMAAEPKAGRPANSFVIVASLDPEVGGVARRLRLNWNFAKALTISGKIEAL